MIMDAIFLLSLLAFFIGFLGLIVLILENGYGK